MTAYRPGPIVAAEAAPLRSLTVTMAVMCYLACLAIGALILIGRASDSWTGALAAEITVQVRQTGKADIEAELGKAEVILKSSPGIREVRVMSRDEAAKLLEPWLGALGGLEDLPVPRLISVTIDPASPPDLEMLKATLETEVAGASIDTHRQWQAELTRMASVLTRLGFAILFLIAVSAVAIVVFASRTVLDANRAIVEVLHLVGARDSFIAGELEWRFLKTGLAAGLIGTVAAIFTFLLLSLVGPWSGAGGVAEASRALVFAPTGSSWLPYAALACVPVTATVIGLITSRVTLMRMLRAAM